MRTLLSLFIVFIFTCSTLSAQWQQCNGPYGGYIRCFTSIDQMIFAGIANISDGGIYRSKDMGQQWEKIGSEIVNQPILTLINNGKEIFAGTKNGIYKSIDLGGTWTRIDNGLTDLQVNALIAKDTVIFAGTNTGIFRSSDNGLHWNKFQNISYVYSFAIEGNAVFATSLGSGVYRSNIIGMIGQNWKQMNKGLEDIDVNSIAAYNTTLLLSTRSGGIYRSTNAGNTWTKVHNGTVVEHANSFLIQGFFIYTTILNEGLYRSSDNGLNWSKINSDIGPYAHSLTQHGSGLFVSSFNSVFRSTDNGMIFTKSDKGIKMQAINALLNDGQFLYAGTVSGLYRSSNNGEDWESIDNGLKSKHIKTLVNNKTMLFCADYESGIYKSTDKGDTWARSGLDNVTVQSVVMLDSTIFAASSYSNIYRSNDNGKNWILVGQSVGKQLCNNDSTIFTANYDGMYKSTNKGDTWKSIGFKNQKISTIYHNGQFLFAATELNGLYRSNDDGFTWETVHNGLPQKNIYCIASNDNHVFIGIEGEGVFVSKDNGMHWKQINDGLKNLETTTLAIKDNTLFAGTYGGSVWKATISFLSSAEEQIYNHTELTLTLSPNPNNGILHISLNNEDTDIPLWVEIFSMHGEKIIEYTTEQNSFTLDINALPNGMYYLLARKGNRSQRQVLSVVR